MSYRKKAKKKKASTSRPSVTMVIQETRVTVGKTANISFDIDDQRVTIKVPAETKAHFTEQFVRPNPTALQRRKYATVMALIRAAYKAGLASSRE